MARRARAGGSEHVCSLRKGLASSKAGQTSKRELRMYIQIELGFSKWLDGI